MAAATDKFKKLSRRWVGQIGAGAVADGTTQTIPLASVTNLPTDTAVVAVIDRVDANGNSTLNLEETIIGVVSGSNLTNAVRGAEGTAQGHIAGAVVEVLVTAKGYNDIIDGIIIGHNQDGTHILDTDGTLAANSDTKIASQKAVKTYVDTNGANTAQGTLANGKIVTSVSSNNITVAIKGLDGNDPSASNKVSIRIGNTVRTITAALSVTKNAGTNWFNAGAAETAALEIDYFVYLGYNATDGVVLGFARRPDGRTYGDFSATTTNPNYAAISTISNATSTDEYELIGRFNAILSATSAFNWSIPGTSIIVNHPIYETRLLTWSPAYSGTGGLTVGTITTNSALYKIRGQSKATCFLQLDTNLTTGGSDNTTILATIPVTALSTTNGGPSGIAIVNGLTGNAKFNSSTQLGILRYDTANIGLSAIYVKADVEAPI